jgi:tripartite-type tricarboxylate transporter receptor subunit TctC
MIRRASRRLALAGAFAAAVLATAQAQEFPHRPITIIVGLAPGGVTDVTTRQYAEVVSKNVGQPIIIENRPAAGGAVAAAAVQNAQPDGYTLLTVAGSQFVSLPAMGASGYDPIKGFAPISVLFRLPVLVVVPFNSPTKSMAELLAWGKTKAGGILLGSPGAGSPGHLLAGAISIGTDTPMQYVHYRGGAPLMADLITERVDFNSRRTTAPGRIWKPISCAHSLLTRRNGCRLCRTFRPWLKLGSASTKSEIGSVSLPPRGRQSRS